MYGFIFLLVISNKTWEEMNWLIIEYNSW